MTADRRKVLEQSTAVYALRLFEMLPSNPIITVSSAIKTAGHTKTDRREAVETLTLAGVLTETTAGRGAGSCLPGISREVAGGLEQHLRGSASVQSCPRCPETCPPTIATCAPEAFAAATPAGESSNTRHCSIGTPSPAHEQKTLRIRLATLHVLGGDQHARNRQVRRTQPHRRQGARRRVTTAQAFGSSRAMNARCRRAAQALDIARWPGYPFGFAGDVERRAGEPPHGVFRAHAMHGCQQRVGSLHGCAPR